MLTTIYVDASFDDRTKAAGWACWIKNAQTKKQFSGPFKADIGTSFKAEVLAIVNAVHCANKHTASSRFHVVTDCEGAISVLKGTGRVTKARRKWKRAFTTALGGKPVTFAHVKAHTGGDDPRSYVNRVCDQEAKRHMRAVREQRQTKQVTA